MTVKAILSPRPSSFKFGEKVLDLAVPVKIGRASKDDKASPDNGFFDSKVLSRPHALLLHQTGQFFLLDTGSSNGTFVNNVRLSKPGVESELTELYTGDIIRFGSDVQDKARNVTQRSVIIKINLITEDGKQYQTRPSSSRLYRPSDNLDDIESVTKNLQDSLSREKVLEEKLSQIMDLVHTIKDKHVTPQSFSGLDSEVSKIFNGNTSTVEEKKKFENLRNEKAVLRKEKRDLEETLKEKEKYCENLQRKAIEDSKNITSLGNIIQKLRHDIVNLETVVKTVKETQEKVKTDYEERMVEERKMFEEELERVWTRDKETQEEKIQLEERLLALLQYESDSSRESVMSTPTTIRQLRDSINLSGMSTPATPRHSVRSSANISGMSTPTSIFLTQGDTLRTHGELANYHDLIKEENLTPELIQEKIEMYDSVKFELEVTKQELDLIRDENAKIRTEVAENINLAKSKQDVFQDLDKAREEIKYLLRTVAEKDDRLEEMTSKVTSLEVDLVTSNSRAVEQQLRASSLNSSQALGNWIEAAESDFENVFQENCLKKSDKNMLNQTLQEEQKVKDGLTGPDSLITKVDPAAATSYGSKILRVMKDYYFMAVLMLMFGMVFYVHVM